MTRKFPTYAQPSTANALHIVIFSWLLSCLQSFLGYRRSVPREGWDR